MCQRVSSRAFPTIALKSGKQGRDFANVSLPPHHLKTSSSVPGGTCPRTIYALHGRQSGYQFSLRSHTEQALEQILPNLETGYIPCPAPLLLHGMVVTLLQGLLTAGRSVIAALCTGLLSTSENRWGDAVRLSRRILIRLRDSYGTGFESEKDEQAQLF